MAKRNLKTGASPAKRLGLSLHRRVLPPRYQLMAKSTAGITSELAGQLLANWPAAKAGERSAVAYWLSGPKLVAVEFDLGDQILPGVFKVELRNGPVVPVGACVLSSEDEPPTVERLGETGPRGWDRSAMERAIRLQNDLDFLIDMGGADSSDEPDAPDVSADDTASPLSDEAEGSSGVSEAAALYDRASMSENPTRDEIKAQIEAAEARTDVKFERLLAEIRTSQAAVEKQIAQLDGKIGALPSTFIFISTMVATGLTVIAIMLAAMSYANDRFGQGFSAAEVAEQAARRAIDEAAARQPTPPPAAPAEPATTK